MKDNQQSIRIVRQSLLAFQSWAAVNPSDTYSFLRKVGNQRRNVAAASRNPMPKEPTRKPLMKRRLRKTLKTGGESGIRTHVRVSPKHAFQACAFSHSAISPETRFGGKRVGMLWTCS